MDLVVKIGFPDVKRGSEETFIRKATEKANEFSKEGEPRCWVSATAFVCRGSGFGRYLLGRTSKGFAHRVTILEEKSRHTTTGTVESWFTRDFIR